MKALESLQESSKDELYSLTDFWASCLVYKLLQQVRSSLQTPWECFEHLRVIATTFDLSGCFFEELYKLKQYFRA